MHVPCRWVLCVWCKDLQKSSLDRVDMLGPLRWRSRFRFGGDQVLQMPFLPLGDGAVACFCRVFPGSSAGIQSSQAPPSKGWRKTRPQAPEIWGLGVHNPTGVMRHDAKYPCPKPLNQRLKKCNLICEYAIMRWVQDQRVLWIDVFVDRMGYIVIIAGHDPHTT